MQTFFALHAFSDWGLLALRIALGIVFIVHGTKKLDGKMGGFMAFIGWCELLGGIAVFLGFLTQLAALGLGIIMIGAWYKKVSAWKVPFAAQDKTGWEFDMTLLAICVALFFIGGGLYALDAVFWGL